MNIEKIKDKLETLDWDYLSDDCYLEKIPFIMREIYKTEINCLCSFCKTLNNFCMGIILSFTFFYKYEFSSEKFY